MPIDAAQAQSKVKCMPSSSTQPLTRAQINEFKSEGVLTLPDFIESEQLASWRQQVTAGLAAAGTDLQDRSTWPQEGGYAPVDMQAPLTPAPGELPQFQALITQLGGGYFAGGGAQIAPIFASKPNRAAPRLHRPLQTPRPSWRRSDEIGVGTIG